MVRTSFRLCLKKRKLKKGSGKDRISNLPDHLLCLILSKLSTKDSVRTSVLSERWRDLWLHVPALDLDTRNFRDDIEFLDFVDRLLESNKEFDIKRFKLYFESYDAGEDCHDKFVRMISEMLKRRVCHLTVLNCPEFDDAVVLMPLSIYSCASLVDLTLYGVVMDNPESELVSLPCVKSIHLEAIEFDGISILETLISNCPVLENLVVITHFDYSEVLCVRSQSLKSFKLHSRYNEGADPVFEIDAPRLEYMSITDYPWQKFRIHNIGPSTEVNIDVESDFEDLEPLDITMIRDFFIRISKVRKMRITAPSLVAIHSLSKLEPLPHFTNLSFLNASLSQCCWDVLATFLGCCLKLHSLVVELDKLPDIEKIEVSPLPLSLKFVTLETLIPVTEIPNRREVSDYFLRNCPDLNKVVFI